MISSISGISSMDISKLIENFAHKKKKSTAESEENMHQYIDDVYNSVNSSKNGKLKSNGIDKKDDETNVDYKELAKKLKEIANVNGVYFEFVLDEESTEMLMRVIDEKTKQIIRQYPSEITLKIAKIINDTLGQGQIANVKI